jgi:hypothetical protein
MLKFTYKGNFFTMKKAYGKSKWWAHALVPPLHIRVVFFKNNTKISIFGGISKFFELIVFGQILVVLGKFYCIGSG